MAKKGGSKKDKAKLVKLPTVYEDIFLRADPGTEQLDLPVKALLKLHRLAKKYSAEKLRIEKLNKGQSGRKADILEIIKAFDGLRGIISEIDNFIVTSIPKGSIEWDRDLLKESLKAAYSAYVAEELKLTISIPLGLKTAKNKVISEESLSEAITKALLGLGIPEEDLGKILKKEVALTIDQEKLDPAIGEGRIKLLPGTKQKDLTFDLRVDLANKG